MIPGTNGSAALLAQTLTASGYVTLRYDKRASGPHALAGGASVMQMVNLQDSQVTSIMGSVQISEAPPSDILTSAKDTTEAGAKRQPALGQHGARSGALPDEDPPASRAGMRPAIADTLREARQELERIKSELRARRQAVVLPVN